MEDPMMPPDDHLKRAWLKLTLCFAALISSIMFIDGCGRLLGEKVSKPVSNGRTMCRMDKEYRLNQVLEISQDPSGSLVRITADRSGELWMHTKSREEDLKVLISSLTKRRLIAILFEAETREIEGADYALVDPIVFVSDPQESGKTVRVASMTTAAPLVLRKDHPRFPELYSRLAKAYANRLRGVKAALAVPRGTCYDIMDVILIEPAPAHYKTRERKKLARSD
jgi:hypothetical protein